MNLPGKAEIAWLTVCAAISLAALAQTTTTAPGPRQQQTGQVPVTADEEPDMMQQRMHDKQLKQMLEQRQKENVAQSAKLLSLTAALKSDFANSPGSELSAAQLKKAEEIEKLARHLKDSLKAP